MHAGELERSKGTALIAAAHFGHDGVVRQLIAGAPLGHVNKLVRDAHYRERHPRSGLLLFALVQIAD
jgi:hypothetical protein